MIKSQLVDDTSVGFVVMKPGETVDIDTQDDWDKAETMLASVNKKSEEN